MRAGLHRIPVIDAHVHLYPPEASADPAAWAAHQGEAHWSTLVTRRRKDGRPVQAFPSLDELLAMMDRDGVARVILLGWYWNRPENAVRQNRFYADCVRAHPERLAACATLHPVMGREAALEELQWASGEGMVGLGELSPHSQGFSPADPLFRELLDRAADLGLPVNLHVTEPECRPFPGRVETPLGDFRDLVTGCARTTFILAHWGGRLPLVMPELAALPNVYYDTAASPLLYDADIWVRMVRAVGADRVLFGTDYPLDLFPRRSNGPDFASLAEEARASGLTAGELRKVLSENAALLFPQR